MSSKIRVLHVDDDDDIRVITKLAFSLDEGFELEQCSSGAEALEKARAAPPDLLRIDFESTLGEGTTFHIDLPKTTVEKAPDGDGMEIAA